MLVMRPFNGVAIFRLCSLMIWYGCFFNWDDGSLGTRQNLANSCLIRFADKEIRNRPTTEWHFNYNTDGCRCCTAVC